LAGNWAATPPEVNASELIAGDHAASITAAAAAYEALADALLSESALMGATTAGTADAGWQGLGGVAMVGTATTYIAALEALVGWLQASAAGASGIAESYNTAFATMIPEPVCTTNRVAQAEAVASNFMGFRTPEIVAYDTEYFGHMWTNNAAVMGAYESAVMAILDTLTVPPPIAPPTANAAGAAGEAASVAQAGANVGMNAALSQAQTVNDAAAPTTAQAAATPAAAGQSMSSMAPQMLGQLAQLPQMAAQFPQMAGQLPQMVGQLPQMLGQLPQMATGLLGPLANPAPLGDLAGSDAAAATLSQTALTSGMGAAGGGAGGGGGFGAAGAGVISSFTRPTSSFNAPNPPKLPAGWSSVNAEPPAPVATATQAAGGGMGGLYGAPPMTGREGSGPEKAPARTMQLTGRPAPHRGDDRQN
jgi:PPE-repeat protein